MRSSDTFFDITSKTTKDVLKFSFRADSGRTFSYSTLDKCFSLFVTEINEQVIANEKHLYLYKMN